MAVYQINDAIHKIITFSEREKAVIDHPFFQRLRYIRQLAFVSFVYPGAVHDRFSHSLGAMHVAGRMADQFLYNEEYSVLARVLSEKEKELLKFFARLAALLHDAGHPPFSHAAESGMPKFKELDLPKSWFAKKDFGRKAAHEDYSVLIIKGLSAGKNSVLSEAESEIIASLIHKHAAVPKAWDKLFSKNIDPENLHKLVRSWISGDADADRMDYLLRDSYFIGVPYGSYDLNWLINNLGVIKRGSFYVTSISESGVHAFEHYILARFNMFAQVYFHKTVRCFEYYLGNALAKKEIIFKIPSDISDYVALRDSTFVERLFAKARARPKSWSGRLMAREPAKRIARVWGDFKTVNDAFVNFRKDLAVIKARPFLVFSKSKFLDYEEGLDGAGSPTGPLFSAFSMTPIVVVRKQFGVPTSVKMDDYSFVLKHYHKDISMGDIFILREEFEEKEAGILEISRKHLHPAPSEFVLE
ncbi:MAG: HD domain-containing protein [Patescibacteria group bacterium]